MPFCANCGKENEAGAKFCADCGQTMNGGGNQGMAGTAGAPVAVNVDVKGLVSQLGSFDKMITPVIIKIIFWIGLVASGILGLLLIFSGLTASFGGGGQVVTGLLALVVGPIFARVYCELLILFFKIHESLISISYNLDE